MIRILCYNIHGGYDLKGKRDLTRLNKLMDDFQVDIGVFQEFETRRSRGATLKDIDITAGAERPYRLPGLALIEDEGWYGNLIVSRYPIINAAVHDLETSPSREPRNAVDAIFDTPKGNLRILGTHLSLSPWERWSEVKNLISLMRQVEVTETGPLLIMGDINEWRSSSKLLKFMNEHFSQIVLKKTFPTRFPLFKLDRVWHENLDEKTIKARTLKTNVTKTLSDHVPILIEIDL